MDFDVKKIMFPAFLNGTSLIRTTCKETVELLELSSISYADRLFNECEIMLRALHHVIANNKTIKDAVSQCMSYIVRYTSCPFPNHTALFNLGYARTDLFETMKIFLNMFINDYTAIYKLLRHRRDLIDSLLSSRVPLRIQNSIISYIYKSVDFKVTHIQLMEELLISIFILPIYRLENQCVKTSLNKI